MFNTAQTRTGRLRRLGRLAAAAVAVAALVGCASTADGGASGGGSSGDAGALDEVTLASYAVPSGIIAYIPYGIQQGYFEDNGIDLTIQWSKGSQGAVTDVASNIAEYSITSAESMTAARAKGGTPLKMVMGINQENAVGVFYKKDSGISEPEDLAGHTLAGGNGSTDLKEVPTYLEHYGVDPASVETLPMAQAALLPAFIAGQTDTMISLIPAISPQLEAEGVDFGFFRYAEGGIGGLSYGLVTTDDQIADNPDLVKRMARAVKQSWDGALKDPEGAAQALSENQPAAKINLDVAAESMSMLGDYTATANTAGMPFGEMAEADWTEIIKIAELYDDVPAGSVTPDELYTNEFVPGE